MTNQPKSIKYTIPLTILLAQLITAYIVAYFMVNQIDIQPTFQFSPWDYATYIYTGLIAYTLLLASCYIAIKLIGGTLYWARVATKSLIWLSPLGILAYLGLIILLLHIIFNIRFQTI